MRALLYVRVSSKEQEKEGFSLDAQEKLGYDYALRTGLTIKKVWKVSESAWKKDRVAFDQMVESAKKHPEIKHIIFDVPDRMTRNDFDKLKIYTLVKEFGKTVHFSRSNRKWNSESAIDDEFMLDIEVAAAKRQSNDISRKTRMGMLEKAEQGLYPSTAPLGYLNNKLTGLIDIDEDRAPYIRQMFELMASGRQSLAMISDTLYSHGLRNKKGHKCGKSSIAHFLGNPIYYGTFVWKGKLYQGSHSPIITKELFDKAQEVMHGKSKVHIQNKGFAFNNLILCGECGCKVIGEQKKRKYNYYHCTFSKGRHAGKTYVPENRIAELFEDTIKSVTIDEKTAEWLKDALREENKESTELQEKRLQTLKTQHERVNNRISRLLDAKFDNEITEETFIVKEKEYQSQLFELKAQMDVMERRNPNYYETASQILELSKRMYPLYVKANYEEKAKLASLVASNYELQTSNDVTLMPEMRKPFNWIAEGSSRSKWLPPLGSNQGQSG